MFDKLEQFVDMLSGQWARLTAGKRGEDDVTGFLWIAGIVLLILDLFMKKIWMLIVGIIFVAYGLFRCFSPFSFHDTENRILGSFLRGIKSIFIRIWDAASGKLTAFKDADKRDMIEQVKNKIVPDEQTKQERAEEKAMKDAYYIFDCPGCKQKVRIPNRGKKGRVAIVCPACQTRFVRMRW